MRTCAIFPVAAIALMVSSCTTPYSPPVFEPSDDPGFDGLLDHAKQMPVKTVVVHGMCTHTGDWVEDRAARYARGLGVEDTPVVGEPIPVGDLDVYEVAIVPPEANQIDFEFIVWSKLTSPLKDHLKFDTEVDYVRASLNEKLKLGLMNECLSDAVIYAGAAGQPLRDAMDEVTCQAFGGRLDTRGVCVFPDAMQQGEVVLIAESLGSKLIFDAVRRLARLAEAQGDAAAAEMLTMAVGRTQAIYLLANQIPILDLADAQRGASATDSLPADSLASFAELVERGRAEEGQDRPIEKLEVVAFSDPNDLLSYSLSPERLEAAGVEVRVVNVLVSNDTTYAGYVEHPLHAHDGYKTNDDVAKLISMGNHPG